MIYYDEPIVHRRRSGDVGDEFIEIVEPLKLDGNGRAILTELPYKFNRVKVEGEATAWSEIEEGELSADNYKVDYKNKMVSFHISHSGKQLSFSYLGTGVTYVPASMVYTEFKDGNITETLQELRDETIEVRDNVNQLTDGFSLQEQAREDNELIRQQQETGRQTNTQLAIDGLNESIEDFKLTNRAMIFIIPGVINPAVLEPHAIFPFDGQIMEIRAFCVTSGDDDTTIQLEKSSDMINWSVVTANPIKIPINNYFSDNTYTLIPDGDLVTQNEIFRLNVINSGQIRNLTLEVKVKII